MENQEHKIQIPHCVGIIMDGNRRWAKGRGRPTHEGHAAGKDKLKEVAEWARDVGVQHLICYTFSTENWNRSEDEVSAIENLLIQALRNEVTELAQNNVRLRFIGERERFSRETQDLMNQAEELTRANTLTLGLALSYGGRSELAYAAERARAEGPITEASLSKHLWTADIPDPDLIIRTGGQQRLSNFLLWQAAYSELWFTDTLWPDFSHEEFQTALDEYAARKRNFGK